MGKDEVCLCDQNKARLAKFSQSNLCCSANISPIFCYAATKDLEILLVSLDHSYQGQGALQVGGGMQRLFSIKGKHCKSRSLGDKRHCSSTCLFPKQLNKCWLHYIQKPRMSQNIKAGRKGCPQRCVALFLDQFGKKHS